MLSPDINANNINKKSINNNIKYHYSTKNAKKNEMCFTFFFWSKTPGI